MGYTFLVLLLWNSTARTMYLQDAQFLQQGWVPGFGCGFGVPVLGKADLTNKSLKFLGRLNATIGSLFSKAEGPSVACIMGQWSVIIFDMLGNIGWKVMIHGTFWGVLSDVVAWVGCNNVCLSRALALEIPSSIVLFG